MGAGAHAPTRFEEREDALTVATEAGPSCDQLGRDDVRVLVVHRLEGREVEVGRWVARGHVEARSVGISFCYDGAVGGCLPFEDAAVVKKVDTERHLWLFRLYQTGRLRV